jgi:hypothetical protein
MNHKDFRRLALGLRDTVESSHMNHPDFRVNDRIFATLKHDGLTGVAMLTPEQQQEFVLEDPKTFSPESGAWGRSGSTKILLESADEDAVGRALTLARQNTLDKSKKRPARKPLKSVTL